MSLKQKQENMELRERSGKVNSNDPLVSFLYILLRDHLPAGVVEGIVRNHVNLDPETEFCNGYIAKYAKDLAERLKVGAPL